MRYVNERGIPQCEKILLWARSKLVHINKFINLLTVLSIVLCIFFVKLAAFTVQ